MASKPNGTTIGGINQPIFSALLLFEARALASRTLRRQGDIVGNNYKCHGQLLLDDDTGLQLATKRHREREQNQRPERDDC